MKRREPQTKHLTAIKQIFVFGYFVWEGKVSIKIKRWGDEGEKYKTSLSPPPSDITSFLPFSKIRKNKGEKKNKNKKKNTHRKRSFRKQFYVTYKLKKRV